MTTETINGLHKCQPKNEPKEGDTKNLVVLHIPAKGTKKPWIKIKSEAPDKGGSPYRIVSVTPTGWEPDDYGNISFNLEVEAISGVGATGSHRAVEAERCQDQAEPRNTALPSQQAETGNGKIESYAKHAGHIFAKAWEESKNAMALIPRVDAEQLSVFEWLDLRLRIAQGFTIEINKIIRKERF